MPLRRCRAVCPLRARLAPARGVDDRATAVLVGGELTGWRGDPSASCPGPRLAVARPVRGSQCWPCGHSRWDTPSRGQTPGVPRGSAHWSSVYPGAGATRQEERRFLGGHNLLVIPCGNFPLKDREDLGLEPAPTGRQRICDEAPGPDSEKEPGTHASTCSGGGGRGWKQRGFTVSGGGPSNVPVRGAS